MIRLHKINNETVSAIPDFIGKGTDNRKVKGQNVLDLYHNVFLCAKKKTGKTSCIFKILKECATKDTIVVFFVSTLYKDSSYLNIRKYLDTKNIQHLDFTSLKNENGEDILSNIIKELEIDGKAAEEEEKEEKPKSTLLNLCESESDDECKKKKKSKYISPEYFFVFDDISNELKSSSVVALSKKNRHYKSSCLYASQYILDLDPQTRKQIDSWLIFKGQSTQKLEIIYKDADISIDFPQFERIYKLATSEPYSFLNINTRTDIFMKSFNTEIKIKSQ